MLKIENIRKVTIEWYQDIEDKIKSSIVDSYYLEDDRQQDISVKLTDDISLNFNMHYCTEWTEVEQPDVPEIISRSVYIKDIYLFSSDDVDYTEFNNEDEIEQKIIELFEI